MNNSIISIGHGNFFPTNKILAILSEDTRAVKPIISKAGLNLRLIDATKGRRLKTVILTTDGYVVLSSISPLTIAKRYAKEEGKEILAIGGNNFIPNSEVLSILQKDSAPIKEMLKMAQAQDRVVKATMGKKTKAIISTSSGFFILSFLSPKTLSKHFADDKFTNQTKQ